MNKKELRIHLNEARHIEIGDKKLREVLKRIGLQHLRQYTSDDVENIIRAIELIDQEGGTEAGYKKAAALLGGDTQSDNGSSGSSKRSPKNGSAETSNTTDKNNRHTTLNDLLDEKVSEYVGGVIRQKAAAFLNSDEGFEYFADIVTEELVGAFDNSYESWAERDLRTMRNVTPRTVEIEGQAVGGLPSSEVESDGADFHTYTETETDTDPENPDDKGGQEE